MADERKARAEAMLDRIFTPAWREQGGKGPKPSATASDFARLCMEHCYADAWSREGSLDLKTRSLVTLAVLVSLGSTDELKQHVHGALNLGHQAEDIIELFIHLLPYLGTPRLVHAMRCASEVFKERAAK